MSSMIISFCLSKTELCWCRWYFILSGLSLNISQCLSFFASCHLWAISLKVTKFTLILLDASSP